MELDDIYVDRDIVYDSLTSNPHEILTGYSISYKGSMYYIARAYDNRFYLKTRSFSKSSTTLIGDELTREDALIIFKMEAMARGVYGKDISEDEIAPISRTKPPVNMSSSTLDLDMLRKSWIQAMNDSYVAPIYRVPIPSMSAILGLEHIPATMPDTPPPSSDLFFDETFFGEGAYFPDVP